MKGFIAKLVAATALTAAATIGGTAALPSASASVAAQPASAVSVSSAGCGCGLGWSLAKQAFAVSLPALREGASGTYVLAVQGALDWNGGDLQGTGYFGANTLAAVQAYQGRHHINPSGLVGFKTWVSLMESNGVTPPKPLANPQVSPGQRWPAGSVGWNAKSAVAALSESFDWATQPSGDDSVYNRSYVASVKSFQSRVGINPSGIYGARTACALALVEALRGHCGC